MAAALVAHTSAKGQTGGTTAAINTTGATLLVITIADNTSGVTVSDNKGNTWTYTGVTEGTSTANIGCVYCSTPTVGSGHTFTVTTPGVSYLSFEVAAFSGVVRGAVPLINQGASITGAPSQTSLGAGGSVTPGYDNELILTAVALDSGTATVDSGFTITDQVALVGGVNYGSALAYLVQATRAAVNPTWNSSGDIYGVIMLSFRTYVYLPLTTSASTSAHTDRVSILTPLSPASSASISSNTGIVTIPLPIASSASVSTDNLVLNNTLGTLAALSQSQMTFRFAAFLTPVAMHGASTAAISLNLFVIRINDPLTLTTDRVTTSSNHQGIYMIATTDAGDTSDLPRRIATAHRASSEGIATSDLPTRFTVGMRRMAETLSLIDVPQIGELNIRSVIETVTTSDLLSRFAFSSRHLSETLSTTDALTHWWGAVFRGQETLTTHDALVRHLTIPRHINEGLMFQEVLARHGIFARHPLESLPLLDVVTRDLALIKRLQDSEVAIDISARLLHAMRASADVHQLSDQLHRAETMHRILTETYGPASDTQTHLANHPLHLAETMVTLDRVSSINLLLAIMGYVYENPTTGNVVASLPDWGFVLIEDPGQGNMLTYAPIPSGGISPLREK